MNLNNLRQHELIKLIESYDRYIQNANNEDLFSMGWIPVCISEYYDCEYQEEVTRDYITIEDKLVVTDPCYKLGIWCQAVIDNMEPGRYECFLDTANMKEFGIRNARIMICHEDYDAMEYYPKNLENDCIAVDSGQAGFFEYKYYEENRGTSDIKNGEASDIFYDKCGKITLRHEDQAGTFDDKCYVSSSGFGDGCYCLYSARNSAGKIVSLELEFISEDGEDEE